MCATRTRSRVAASSRPPPAETPEKKTPQQESEKMTRDSRSTSKAASARISAQARERTAAKQQESTKKQKDEADTDPAQHKSASQQKEKRKGREMTRTQTKRQTKTKTETETDTDTETRDPSAEEPAPAPAPATTTKTAGKKRKAEEQLDDEMAAPLAARAQGIRKFIGAHVSAAGGVQNAIPHSIHIGGNAFSLFLKSQRRWANPPLDPSARDAFKAACQTHNYDASKCCLPHGSYLVNLASEDAGNAERAYSSFLDDLRRCEELGISLYNFHPGSAGSSDMEESMGRLAKALTRALKDTKTVIPTLETMCGQGNTIGGSLSQFRNIIAQIPTEYHSRVAVCVDTCHSFAAGYDLRSREAWDAFIAEFDATIGLRFLRAFHLNDSKTPLGSHRDLHANIGTGFLGLRAFHNLMNDERLNGLPMILETPIDRPVIAAATSSSPSEAPEAAKGKGKGKKAPKSSAETKDDPGVWAREIKILESLVGMDTDSKEFRELEAALAEEGKAERAVHQAQFDKKQLEAKKKEDRAKQKDLKSMFAKKGGGKKGKKQEEEEEDEEQKV